MSGLTINPFVFATPGGGSGFYGISSHGTLSTSTTSDQVGWEFAVGSSDLEVTKLRAKLSGSSGNTEVLRLWYMGSEKIVIASAEIISADGSWVEATLDAPAVLKAGESYVVTTRRKDGSARAWGFVASTGVTLASYISYTQARTASSTGFPTVTSVGDLYGVADIFANTYSQDGTLTLVSRSPGGISSANFATGQTYSEFTPSSAFDLAGLSDAYQASNAYLKAMVWRVSDQVLLAESHVVPQMSGVHRAEFDTPVSLTSGTAYRIGWVVPSATSYAVKATTASSSWSGFTVPQTAYYNSSGINLYPSESVSGYQLPADLLEA